MARFSTRIPASRRCSGVVLHHRLEWWLVEFPKDGANPTAIQRLTGNLTAGMIENLTAAGFGSDDRYAIGSPYPSDLYSLGDFRLVPSDRSLDLFDIDACHRLTEADTPAVRLARVMIETTLFPLPSDFVSVLTAVPKNDRPVLAIRLSGYVCSTFELLTARYMPAYRRLSPWRDISNEAVGDSGDDILGWRHADDWLALS